MRIRPWPGSRWVPHRSHSACSVVVVHRSVTGCLAGGSAVSLGTARATAGRRTAFVVGSAGAPTASGFGSWASAAFSVSSSSTGARSPAGSSLSGQVETSVGGAGSPLSSRVMRWPRWRSSHQRTASRWIGGRVPWRRTASPGYIWRSALAGANSSRWVVSDTDLRGVLRAAAEQLRHVVALGPPSDVFVAEQPGEVADGGEVVDAGEEALGAMPGQHGVGEGGVAVLDLGQRSAST